MGSRECDEWLRFARDDLEAAEYLLGMQPRKIEIICYHCQQCAEKALKAGLALFDDDIPRTHSLGTLLKACSLRFEQLHQLVACVALLQPYAISVRYPYELSIQSGDDEQAISNAKKVFCTMATGIQRYTDIRNAR